jgi:uncharacterized protein (TIGR03435 family)
MRRSFLVAVFACLCAAALRAQTPAPVEFDVVSIKRNTSGNAGGGGRTLPDGTEQMTNFAIRQFIGAASPVPTREVIGLPDWAMTERYDVVLKPPPGSTQDQQREMWRTMFATRMKLAAHVEQRERDVYLMTLARSDGRLGPELKPSPLDCSPPARGTPPPAPRTTPPTDKEILGMCGMRMGPGLIISGGMRLNNLAVSLSGLAGGEIEDRTGLDGFYTVTLKFSVQRSAGAPLDANAADEAPDIFTALREQLGLKLEREKQMRPVFVIDHIERPTEN